MILLILNLTPPTFSRSYVKDPADSKYSPDIKWRLIRYWTEDLPEKFRLTFNDTCYYSDTGYKLTDKLIKKTSEVGSMEKCEELCQNYNTCRYFMYSSTINDEMGTGECWLYESGARVVEMNTTSGATWKGITWGDVKCFNMSECPFYQETPCLNKIMTALMNAPDKESESESNTTTFSPPTCYEPCTYRQFNYELSSSDYPTERYWNSYLSDKGRYDNYADAKANLVKLVFYTDHMMNVQEIQTASYEYASFIAELGGLVDLFIGISFFTCYQIMEWVMTKTIRTFQCRR